MKKIFLNILLFVLLMTPSCFIHAQNKGDISVDYTNDTKAILEDTIGSKSWTTPLVGVPAKSVPYEYPNVKVAWSTAGEDSCLCLAYDFTSGTVSSSCTPSSGPTTGVDVVSNTIPVMDPFYNDDFCAGNCVKIACKPTSTTCPSSGKQSFTVSGSVTVPAHCVVTVEGCGAGGGGAGGGAGRSKGGGGGGGGAGEYIYANSLVSKDTTFNVNIGAGGSAGGGGSWSSSSSGGNGSAGGDVSVLSPSAYFIAKGGLGGSGGSPGGTGGTGGAGGAGGTSTGNDTPGTAGWNGADSSSGGYPGDGGDGGDSPYSLTTSFFGISALGTGWGVNQGGFVSNVDMVGGSGTAGQICEGGGGGAGGKNHSGGGGGNGGNGVIQVSWK